MKKALVFFLIIAALVLSGCQAAATQSGPPTGGAAPVEAPAFNSGPDSFEFDRSATGAGEEQGQSGVERLVIRNANLTIVVEMPGDAMTAVSTMAETMGGYVVSSNLYKTTTERGEEIPEANITIRVPAEKLNEALAQIKALVKDPAEDVLSENVSGQDVTKEYTDLRSRLKNLEDTEAQLREIMASTTRTEDVLNVYQQLTSVREQIEVLKGQIQYYEESAALSSIALTIRAEEAVQPLQIGGWRPVGVARDAVQALVDTLQFLGSAAIWLLLYIAPVVLVLYFPIRGLIWLLRKLFGRPRKPVVPPPPATTTKG